MGSLRSLQQLRRGLLLLEVLIAGIIFSFVVSSAAATAIYHERALQKHQNRNAATFLAQQEMENLLSESYARLPVAVNNNYPVDIDVRRWVDSSDAFSQYHCEVTLTDSPDGTVRTVLVEVSYTERDETKVVRLETDVFWSQ